MQTFYIAELQNPFSFRKAEKILAKSLASAKRKASKMQCFYGTVLEIGFQVDKNGFILEPISQKINGKWQDYLYY